MASLTCQKVLNSSNERFAVSGSDKISFGLKDIRTTLSETVTTAFNLVFDPTFVEQKALNW